jgi:hypothetical protein
MGSEDDDTAELLQLGHNLTIVVLDLRKRYQLPEIPLPQEANFMDMLELSRR